MTTPKYELTEEHRALAPAWAKKWRDIALRTTQLSPEEWETMFTACRELYKAADLKEPRVISCPSPMSAALATGIGAAVLEARKKGINEKKITASAMAAADHMVRRGVAYLEFGDKEHAVMDYSRQLQSTVETLDKAVEGLEPAGNIKPDKTLVNTMIKQCAQVPECRDGGSEQSSWVSFLSFFRHVVKLGETHGVDYSKWQHYETLAHAGSRFMLEEFCIISDFPTICTLDQDDRPHNPDGPYRVWTDGWALGYWHGTAVPYSWLTRPQAVDPSLGLTWNNIEQRRALCEIIGWETVINQLNPTVIDTNKDPSIGTLIKVDLPDSPNSYFLRVRCPTGRMFSLAVPNTMKTALEANANSYGYTVDSFYPEGRT